MLSAFVLLQEFSSRISEEGRERGYWKAKVGARGWALHFHRIVVLNTISVSHFCAQIRAPKKCVFLRKLKSNQLKSMCVRVYKCIVWFVSSKRIFVSARTTPYTQSTQLLIAINKIKPSINTRNTRAREIERETVRKPNWYQSRYPLESVLTFWSWSSSTQVHCVQHWFERHSYSFQILDKQPPAMLITAPSIGNDRCTFSHQYQRRSLRNFAR